MTSKRPGGTGRSSAIKLVRKIAPDASPSNARRIYRLMEKTKRELVAKILALEADIRALGAEAAALRVLERQEKLILPPRPVSADTAIAQQHALLALRRQYAAGYLPTQHKAMKDGV